MRILFYNHAGEMSGAEQVLLSIVEGARADGHDAILCAPPGPLVHEAERMGIAVVPVAPLALGYTRNPFVLARYLLRAAAPLVGLARALRRARPDLVYANSTRSGLIAVAARLAVRPAPALAVHLHDALHDRFLDRLVAAVIGRAADEVVTISHYVARGLGVDERKVRVLHNAIDPERYRPDPARGRAFRERLGVPPEAPLLAVVGQLTPWKGQMEALEAVALLRRALPAAHLAIVGSAKFVGKHRRYDTLAYRAALLARAARPDLAGHVHVADDVGDVAAVYAAADVVVVPSWREPFGRVVIEAMAAGRPVLATRAGGIPEIVTHEVDGWLAPPRDPAALADAALVLLRDEPLRQRLGVAGHDTVANRFSLHGYTERLRQVWRSASARGDRASRRASMPMGPGGGSTP